MSHAEHDDTPGGHDHHDRGILGERTELIFAVGSGVALVAGWLIDQRVAGLASLICYWIAYGLGGFFTLKEAVQSHPKRQFEIDSLMLVAGIGAAALGEWAEGALLLFLFSIGHALEQFAICRSPSVLAGRPAGSSSRTSRSAWAWWWY